MKRRWATGLDAQILQLRIEITPEKRQTKKHLSTLSKCFGLDFGHRFQASDHVKRSDSGEKRNHVKRPIMPASTNRDMVQDLPTASPDVSRTGSRKFRGGGLNQSGGQPRGSGSLNLVEPHTHCGPASIDLPPQELPGVTESDQPKPPLQFNSCRQVLDFEMPSTLVLLPPRRLPFRPHTARSHALKPWPGVTATVLQPPASVRKPAPSKGSAT